MISTSKLNVLILGCVLLTCVPAHAQLNQRQLASEAARRIHRHGLPNCYQVSEELYRSAQPTAEGMQAAKELGIRTIIDLRSGQSDRERISGTGLGYVHIPMHPTHIHHKDVVEFLRIATDSRRTPVLVHCHAGADRTGLMTAVYRVIVQGWSKQEAIEELEHGGFHFHREFADIPRYIEHMNVAAIRRETGIE